MDGRVDHFTKTSDLSSFDWIPGVEIVRGGMGFVQILNDGDGFD